MTNSERNNLLLERLVKFAQRVIGLCQKFPDNLINKRLVPQVIASTDSMAANYAEACEAESALDFIHKVRIVKKESRETRVHLRMLYAANTGFREAITILGKECVEYIKIFSTIDKNYKLRKKSKKSVHV